MQDVAAWGGVVSQQQMLALAASAERGSEHPIGRAITARAAELGLSTVEPTKFVAAAGEGVECVVTPEGGAGTGGVAGSGTGGVRVLLGNRPWMRGRGLEAPLGAQAEMVELEGRGHTVVLVALAPLDDDGGGAARFELAGHIAVSDELKVEAAAVVQALQAQRIRVLLVSGDNVRTAQHIAARAGIPTDCVHAEVKPAAKAARVEALQREGCVVAMVGDGVNDAPALAQADVGLAVRSGTDVAIETADVVLMKSSLHDVNVAIHLAQVVMRRIRVNFVWAFGYNIIGIPVAAGVFYPMFMLQLPPMFAGAVSAGPSPRCPGLLATASSGARQRSGLAHQDPPTHRPTPTPTPPLAPSHPPPPAPPPAPAAGDGDVIRFRGVLLSAAALLLAARPAARPALQDAPAPRGPPVARRPGHQRGGTRRAAQAFDRRGRRRVLGQFTSPRERRVPGLTCAATLVRGLVCGWVAGGRRGCVVVWVGGLQQICVTTHQCDSAYRTGRRAQGQLIGDSVKSVLPMWYE